MTPAVKQAQTETAVVSRTEIEPGRTTGMSTEAGGQWVRATTATGGQWLRAIRDNWPLEICRLLDAREPAVIRVLVAEVRGSAPREPGACMLVFQEGTQGTIGGGNLEWQAIKAARSLLVAGGATPCAVHLRRLVLGRELSQCCGGVVQLWIERFTRADLPLLRRATAAISDGTPALMATELSGQHVVRRLLEQVLPPALRRVSASARDVGDLRLHFSSPGDETALLLERLEAETTKLWLYGAGHVGQALIRLLADLPFEVTWVDSRAELLPTALPDTIRPVCTQSPVDSVPTAPSGARFLVMTHDHALDYSLCRAVLERGDFAWLGLIGSKSKGARFRSRFARDGLAPEVIARLTCPIGVGGVGSKWPAAIAVGVAAQLLQGIGGNSDIRGAALDKGESTAQPTTVDEAGCSSRDCANCSSNSTGSWSMSGPST